MLVQDTYDYQTYSDEIVQMISSLQQGRRDLNDALNWLGNMGQDDGSNDPSEEFKKLDGLLTKKKGQGLEESSVYETLPDDSFLDWE